MRCGCGCQQILLLHAADYLGSILSEMSSGVRSQDDSKYWSSPRMMYSSFLTFNEKVTMQHGSGAVQVVTAHLPEAPHEDDWKLRGR